MIIEFLPPHAINMGQNFEYISTFINGRHKSIQNMRLLVRGVNDNKEYLLISCMCYQKYKSNCPELALFLG